MTVTDFCLRILKDIRKDRERGLMDTDYLLRMRYRLSSKSVLSTESYCKYKEKFKLAMEIKFVRQKALYILLF